jgi:hypothetical protein
MNPLVFPLINGFELVEYQFIANTFLKMDRRRMRKMNSITSPTVQLQMVHTERLLATYIAYLYPFHCLSSLTVSCFAIAQRIASFAAIRGGGRTHVVNSATVLMLLKKVLIKSSLQANQLKKHTHVASVADPDPEL